MKTHSLRSILGRGSLVPLAVFFMFALVAADGFIAGSAQSSAGGEREVETNIPKHLPIKIEIKKPEKLKDAKNEDWFSDLEVEITNTGNKPIYFVEIAMFLPDVLAEDGRSYGYKLQYGRINLAAFEEPVRPDDIPILPGASVVIEGHPDEVRDWKHFRAKGKFTNPKKLKFNFQEINYGDGTGYVGFDGTPIPARKEQSSNYHSPVTKVF